MPTHAADHRLKPLPYAYDALEPHVSEQVVRWHHDVHQKGYVDKRNEIEEKLRSWDHAKATSNYSEFGEAKRKETFNASGIVLHEIYWEAMGGTGGEPTGALADAIRRDFGSYDAWRRDFVATARAAFGWAILSWDPSDDRLHNYLVDFHHHGAVWGAVPLLPIDVWEHAYYKDRGPDKAAYIDAFFRVLHWPAVEERWKRHVEPVRALL